MKHQEGTLKTIKDLKVYHQSWNPENTPKAVIIIVHGLAEHSGRYMNLINHLLPLGYSVYGIDHIGHGKSEGKRVFVESFEDYTYTLEQYFDFVKKQNPDAPVYLFGHSMGGLIAAAYLLDHQDELQGAILSAPAIKKPDHLTPLIIAIGRFLSSTLPAFRMIKLEEEGMSRDKEVVEAYANDPLVYSGKVTARLGAELLNTMDMVEANASRIKIPLLIMQGSEDRLIEPAGAQMLYDTAGSKDKKLNIYDGLYHELINEPEKDQVLKDIQGWLETH